MLQTNIVLYPKGKPILSTKWQRKLCDKMPAGVHGSQVDDRNLSVSFKDFVEFGFGEKRHGMKGLQCNAHWKPMTYICDPCANR